MGLPLQTNLLDYKFIILLRLQLGKISEISNLKVGEDEIKRVKKTKYLGLTTDETMSWNQQYKIVKGKLKGGLDSIRKLRPLLPQSQLFQVYRALVESHLRYGNLLWGHLSATKLNNLQKLQDRAMTLIQCMYVCMFKFATKNNLQ